ncbi:F-box/LRR-repeat protein 13 [Sciurus carolinensis]|uniref:F-box/LRR-repeat protein 13 n=1 Tax=Sciurus carolinensis TaxID=30640 RepID=A0AA41T3T3_SCICA|nr:F-box/LRR-repeat protein 13 [Sciurus carolinensis]
MIMAIIENGLESLRWDTCIDPLMKQKIRRLSETYLEQLFGLDDQLVIIKLMIKACTFYTGNLVKTYFCTWKEIVMPHINEDDTLAEKMEKAITYYNSRLQKSSFHRWYTYTKIRKAKLQDALMRIRKIFHYKRQMIFLQKWQDAARLKKKIREEELDESMKHISEGCPGVLYLNLSNTTITNKTMRLLPKHFHNLQNLSLAYCRKFTDKGLQYLNLGNGCHKLIYLDLSGCTQISVQGFKNIASSCSGVMHLTINDMPTLTDNCVKALVEKCQSITSVVFIGSPHISDGTFKALSTCDLRKIRFEGNKRITDACFKFIDKNYPNIHHIYMVDCKGITDGSLKSLSPLKHLTVLNLANCVSCRNLNYLSLRNCEQLTDQGIEHIVNIFSLISLDLSGTVISNEGLIVLSRLKKLKELSLSECYRITDFGIQAFCKSSVILEHLDVSYCLQLSDEIIKAVAIYCTYLTSLNIAGCPQITNLAIEMLSAKCHYLHILDISGCVLLTDQILEDLKIGCKQLRILKMQYCRHISMEAAHKMSSVVQQQEYSCSDPPRWFGYDCYGRPLNDQHIKPLKEVPEIIVKESEYSIEEETV